MKLERKPHRDIVRDELELELAELMDLPVDVMPRDIPVKITAQFLSVTPQKLCEWRNNKANIQFHSTKSALEQFDTGLVTLLNSKQTRWLATGGGYE